MRERMTRLTILEVCSAVVTRCRINKLLDDVPAPPRIIPTILESFTEMILTRIVDHCVVRTAGASILLSICFVLG